MINKLKESDKSFGRDIHIICYIYQRVVTTNVKYAHLNFQYLHRIYPGPKLVRLEVLLYHTAVLFAIIFSAYGI